MQKGEQDRRNCPGTQRSASRTRTKFSCRVSDSAIGSFAAKGRKVLNKTRRANLSARAALSCCRFLSARHCQVTDKLQTQQGQGTPMCETSGLPLLPCRSRSHPRAVERAQRVSAAPQEHSPGLSRICHAASVPRTPPLSPALCPRDGS